jgi:uncharacterized membrane protein YkvA (DUF1232 family)
VPDRNRSAFSLSNIIGSFQLVYRLYQDDRVPTVLKVSMPLLVALYFVMPFDLIPDFLPGVGELDDLGVAILAMNLFVRLAPQGVVEEHRRALGLGGPPAAPEATTRLYDEDRPVACRRPAGSVMNGSYTVVNSDK